VSVYDDGVVRGGGFSVAGWIKLDKREVLGGQKVSCNRSAT